MTEYKIVKTKEKQEIERRLNKQFGIEEIKGTLFKNQDQVYIFQGEISKQEIKTLIEITSIQGIGILLLKYQDNQYYLTTEATQILKDQITKNIFELNEAQAKDWLEGNDLYEKTNEKGIFVIKYKDYFLGCGKASENKISNFLPKSRRLKSKSIIK